VPLFYFFRRILIDPCQQFKPEVFLPIPELRINFRPMPHPFKPPPPVPHKLFQTSPSNQYDLLPRIFPPEWSSISEARSIWEARFHTYPHSPPGPPPSLSKPLFSARSWVSTLFITRRRLVLSPLAIAMKSIHQRSDLQTIVSTFALCSVLTMQNSPTDS